MQLLTNLRIRWPVAIWVYVIQGLPSVRLLIHSLAAGLEASFIGTAFEKVITIKYLIVITCIQFSLRHSLIELTSVDLIEVVIILTDVVYASI
jgi:hypothetical protein